MAKYEVIDEKEYEEAWRGAHNLVAAYEGLAVIKGVLATAAAARRDLIQMTKDLTMLESNISNSRNILSDLEQKISDSGKIWDDRMKEIEEGALARSKEFDEKMDGHVKETTTAFDKMTEDRTNDIARLDGTIHLLNSNIRSKEDFLRALSSKEKALNKSIEDLTQQMASAVAQFTKKDA